MALSRKAWVAGGLVALLLTIAFLAISVQLKYANHTRLDYSSWHDYYRLQSYTYAVAIVFLLVSMVLSLLATVVAATLRARARNEDE